MLVLVGLPSKIFTAANIGRPKDKQTKQMSGLIIMGQLAMDTGSTVAHIKRDVSYIKADITVS